ncbi:MAG: 6-bladed beta-propeller [Oscillospiraceae bacterium]|nr:6-bladed beta-propeller [Oscillospiraceae bacterium]
MENALNFEYVPMDFTLRKMPDVAGVAVDSADNIFFTTRICPGFGTPVVVMDPDGKYLRGFGAGIVKNAHGLCIDNDDNVFVVDANRNCIFKFSVDGELLGTIGEPDRPCDNGCINYDFRTISFSSDNLNHPSKIDFTDDGGLYVADGYGNARVHHFAKDGTRIKSWGNPGDGPGEFNVVHGIGVDRQNNDVYVCDRENERVQIFDADGNLKAIWDNIWRPTDVCIRGDYVYVAELGELFYIDNVLFEPGTRHHHSQCRVFDKHSGKELAQIGTADGGAKGSFWTAHGVCLTGKDELLVSEVSIPYGDIWTAYPQGMGMSSKFHPCLQKFRQVN